MGLLILTILFSVFQTANAQVPIDCTGLVDLTSELVDTEIMPRIPADPTGISDNGAGYEIFIDTNGLLTVTAPDAELGEVISVSR